MAGTCECGNEPWVYIKMRGISWLAENILYKYTMKYQSNTKLYYVYYLLGQHVSILIESSSGPSKIQILT